MLSNKRFVLMLGLALGLVINTAYATQTCNSNITDQWPNSRYTDNDDGTVTDTVTGLMWMQCSEGQTSASNACTGTATTYNWKAALGLAKNKTLAGHSDWRLPNIKEQISLVARNCSRPSINQTLFPNSSVVWYWSSTPDNLNNNNALVTVFTTGFEQSQARSSSNSYVRLVRGG